MPELFLHSPFFTAWCLIKPIGNFAFTFILSRGGATIDEVWIGNRILYFTGHYHTDTSASSHVFSSRCLVAATEPLPSNGCLCWLHNSGFRQTYHSTYVSVLWESIVTSHRLRNTVNSEDNVMTSRSMVTWGTVATCCCPQCCVMRGWRGKGNWEMDAGRNQV
jgi:hypothetical protein